MRTSEAAVEAAIVIFTLNQLETRNALTGMMAVEEWVGACQAIWADRTRTAS